MNERKKAMRDHLISLEGYLDHTTDPKNMTRLLSFWGIDERVLGIYKHTNKHGVISVFIETDSEIRAIARSL